MAQGFTVGSMIMIVEHDAGRMDKEGLISAYIEIASGLNTDKRQSDRISRDMFNLMQLSDDSRYFMVVRQRTGPKQDYERVRMPELGCEGLLTPVFTSALVLWNNNDAVTIKNLLVEMQNGTYTEETEEETKGEEGNGEVYAFSDAKPCSTSSR